MVTPQPAPSPARMKQAMIVDDEPSVRMLLGLILQSHGYAVTAWADGEQAWQALAADPAAWDVVLTDERMPRLTGQALIRRMRDAGMRTPVVLVSAYLEVTALDTAPEGASALLTKPFELDDVLTVVDGLEHAAA